MRSLGSTDREIQDAYADLSTKKMFMDTVPRASKNIL